MSPMGVPAQVFRTDCPAGRRQVTWTRTGASAALLVLDRSQLLGLVLGSGAQHRLLLEVRIPNNEFSFEAAVDGFLDLLNHTLNLGMNLLRDSSDLSEVVSVAIVDADKEGFLLGDI